MTPHTCGTMSEPIFIVGAPRSGTSLLRGMLNRHPSIGLCDETYYFYYVYSRCRAFGNLRDPANRQRVVERYLATQRIKRLGLDLAALAEVLMDEGDSYAAFFASLMRFYAAAQGKTRYGEKTPQHALVAKTLCEWYPRCTLIHLIRDPRDVVASLLRMPWGHKSVLANARIWLQCTLSAERCRHRHNYLQVQYERLVAEPEAELKHICRFLGEEFAPVMLVPTGGPRADKWWFHRAQSPLTTELVGSWRRQLTAQQVSLVEWVVSPYWRRFGYEPSGQVASVSGFMTALSRELAESIWSRLHNWPRLWYFWVQPTQLSKEEALIDASPWTGHSPSKR